MRPVVVDMRPRRPKSVQASWRPRPIAGDLITIRIYRFDGGYFRADLGLNELLHACATINQSIHYSQMTTPK